jgi:hypothetical protein
VISLSLLSPNSHLGGQAGEAGLEAGSDVEGSMERDANILLALDDRDAVALEADVSKGPKSKPRTCCYDALNTLHLQY